MTGRIALVLCLFLMISATAPAAASPNNPNPTSARVEVLFFQSATCDTCSRLKTEFLPRMQARYGDKVAFRMLEVASVENYRALLTLEKSLGRSIDKTPPLMAVGGQVLEGDRNIRQRLVQLLDQRLSGPAPSWTGVSLTASDRNSLLLNQFRGLTWAAVIGGGLVDGINPCAFTVLILLVSYMALAGRTGRQVVAMGSAFTVGVFLAYFLIGVGLLELLTRLPWLQSAGRLLSWLVAGLCGVMAGLSLYDFHLIKRGRAGEAKLQLSDRLKQRVRSIVRTGGRSGSNSVGAFGMGASVAMLEFPCTGQVYLPVVFIIRQSGEVGLRASGLLRLLVYNAMFILPLIVVFALVAWGVGSARLAALARRHLAAVKLLLAGVFALMTVALLFLT